MTTDYAIVARIKVQPHPDPNVLYLAVGTVCNQTVIVSKDTKDGELGVFFPCELQLSEKFAAVNNLIRKRDPVTGKNIGGMFEDNRRVRPQKFKGIVSYGFWCPLSYLQKLGGNAYSVKEGTELKSWNGIPICDKYYTHATKKALSSSNKNIKRVEEYSYTFPEHQKTKHFKLYANDAYKTGDDIIITSKLHGTSQRVAINTQLKRKKWYHKLIEYVTRQKLNMSETVQLNGTRTVVLNNNNKPGYHPREFRKVAANKLYMHMQPYMQVYFELVGWEDANSLIMPVHHSEKLKEKHSYPQTIQYTYGAPTGTADLYVYRITWVLPTGYEVDWLWDDIVDWCKKSNIKHVPVVDRFVYDGNVERLVKHVESLSDGPDMLCSSHPREGVCVRANSNKWICYKNKGYTFCVLEDQIKDNPDYVDQEEAP